MKITITNITASLLVLGLAGGARSAEYNIDMAHSDIIFKVRHMGISTVTGKFENITGTFNVDPKNVKATQGSAVIDVNSITTGSAKRDKDLKSEEFFNVEKFPSIKFVSKSVKDVNMKDSTCTLIGDLTMRGVTREIALKVKGDGILSNDGWGNERAAFHASGSVNRFDFGLKWNKAVEAGRLVVGEKVELVLAFEGSRKVGAPDAKAAKAGKEEKPVAENKTKVEEPQAQAQTEETEAGGEAKGGMATKGKGKIRQTTPQERQEQAAVADTNEPAPKGVQSHTNSGY